MIPLYIFFFFWQNAVSVYYNKETVWQNLNISSLQVHPYFNSHDFNFKIEKPIQNVEKMQSNYLRLRIFTIFNILHLMSIGWMIPTLI